MSDTTLNSLRTLHLFFYSTLTVVSDITLCVRSDYPLLPSPRARVFTPSLSIFSPFSGGFYLVSPRQLLESDTGVPHFALDPLTHRCLLSLSPAADFAETRTPRHTEYSTFLPSKTPGLFLLYVLGHCPLVLLGHCPLVQKKQSSSRKGQQFVSVLSCFLIRLKLGCHC